MTIKIIETVERIVMTDINDVRSFFAGEIHALTPANEAHLVKFGVAEPSVAVPTPVAELAAPIPVVPAATMAGEASEPVSEAPEALSPLPEPGNAVAATPAAPARAASDDPATS